jgi:acetylornithine deacetylase/succinyl-diaminopimelate desuccinylase-like protein
MGDSHRLEVFFMRRLAVLVLVAPLAAFSLPAAARVPEESVSETAALLSEVIRVDTSNPPGNEARLAELLETKFRPLGFEIAVIPTPQEGKSHFVARLRGDGSKQPVLVAAHADVVGVEREKWTVDPFGGVIRDGYVLGRGAIDFKGGVAVFAQAVMTLAKNKVPLARDVIFLSEADEEGGKYGTRWLADNHWDEIACEFALNEGGWIIEGPDGRVRYVSISTADKSSISLVLTAKGTSTHSSMPRPDNAIFRLSKALARIADYDTAPSLIPSTRQFFSTLAATSDPPMSTYFRNLVEGSDPALVAEADREISKNALLHAVMRNTIAPVLMSAGFRGNVIPGSAEATINFRTIPGTSAEELIAEIRGVVQDPSIEIVAEGFPGLTPQDVKELDDRRRGMKPSSEDTDLYRALVRSAKAVFPEAEVTPWLFQAGTDAAAWRSRGVPVYGIYPYPIDDEDLSRMHGNDERVKVKSLDEGTDLVYRTLVEVAGR